MHVLQKYGVHFGDDIRQFEVGQFEPELIIRVPGRKINKIIDFCIRLPGGMGGVKV